MAAGRPRDDDKIKQNRGTARRDRKERNLPTIDDEARPRKPPHLHGYAAEFWRKHFFPLWEAGWISRLSVASFSILCQIWSDLREVENFLSENGMFCTVPTSTGSKWAVRPETSHLNQLRKDYLKWSEAFGLTPVSSKKFANAKPRADRRREKLKLADFAAAINKGGA